MTCEEVLAVLPDRVARTLRRRDRARGSAHLLRCRPCGAYVRSYVRTVRLARTACSEPPGALPEDLVRTILAARARGAAE